MSLLDKIELARQKIVDKIDPQAQTGIILGTGLGGLIQNIEIEATIDYKDIPGFVNPTVMEHEGKLIYGKLSGKNVLCLQGRFHFYEGYNMEEITFPVRVLKALGCSNLIVSNACGGINNKFQAGDIMVITDHINLLGTNPLIGKNFAELGPRFTDMIEPYSQKFIDLTKRVALEEKIKLQEGVYAVMTGPCLETRAEYRMLGILGADVIGMSTVPEVIVATHAGMNVLGLSVITDECIPDRLKPINVPAIIATAMSAEPKLCQLIQGVLSRI